MTEAISTDADVDSSIQVENAYAELVRMDAQHHADELTRLGATRTPSGADGEDLENGPERTSGKSTSQKKAGRDQVLRFLEDNADQIPGGAELFKGQQQQISKLGTENSETNARMDALERRLGGDTEEESVDPETAERDKRLARFRPDQKQLIQDLLESEGYVKKSALDDEKAEQAAVDFTATSVEAGIEKFGDRFGAMDNGTFKWNEEIADEVKNEFARLTSDETGIVPMDLFWIVEGPKMAAQIEKLERQAGVDASRNEIRRRVNGNTIRTSGPRASATGVVRKAGDLDATVDAAILESLTELNGS
tara:strand:+ start:921 stop:1844 length:924 start_codon:yes stop_codon:yes gene_type:complete